MSRHLARELIRAVLGIALLAGAVGSPLPSWSVEDVEPAAPTPAEPAPSITAPADATSGPEPAPSDAATAPAAATADVSVLRKRAAAFWAARVSRDFRTQWELMEPRASGRTTPEDFAGSRGAVQYLGYEVGEATVTGAFATVKVRVMAQPLMGRSAARPAAPQATVITDRWVRVRGVWYRQLDTASAVRP